ncbi:MAG: sulfatase-like hydrolase/transferase [Drouetiella hepatica Uher 2000/2452]|jgi:arylsulfatase A-like enzyme|uniref:Sulfatase-like hydrolase/transferase n=1 Tax=Drouetiella hepatica Uher 2000/2452 TaxID=904376 RepID=A0A951QHD4_9CYAN|nr:sulfatase-like hydrolase/transferase [Drouetiella hepatica Uher 2000/2452]
MSSRHPDIVFLVLDTQRSDRLSCYGHTRETSPHLDAFAADAALFSNAVSAAQWTVPSHASMFTGLYPSAHQMLQSYSVLPDHITTLAERLSLGGYFTAGFCNNPLVGVINNGLRRGFYSFLNYSGLLTSRPNQVGIPSGWLDQYRQSFKQVVAGALNQVQDAFARSDALLAFSLTPLMVPIWQTALSFKGNTGKSLDDAAQLLIERKGLTQEQPIFAFINLMGTHMPYHPPRHYVERFAPHVLRDKAAQHYLRHFNGDIYGWLAPLVGELDDRQKATLDGMYDAEVAYQDEQVGLFLDRLQQSGSLDQTLVIVCSDHGEHLGEKQFMGHSLSLYNELVQVPLLIRDPAGNFSKGTVRDDVVSTRRLFHTVLTAAGLANEMEETLTLAQSLGINPEQVFAEAIPPQNVVNLLHKRQPELVLARACDQPRRAVWIGNHKLIETGTDRLELYDFCNDPDEALDLSDIFPENVELLQECLQQFTHQTNTAVSTDRAPGFDDPEVRRRLRDLGYLED